MHPAAHRLLLAAALALLSPAAHAAIPVPLRAASHPGFSRLVLDFPAPVRTDVQRAGAQVSITFPARYAAALPPGFTPARLRNLRAASAAPGSLTLTLAPGARLHSLTLGNRHVIDLLDPAPPLTAVPPPRMPPLPPQRITAEPPPPPAIPPLVVDVAPSPSINPVARVAGPAPEPPPRPPVSVASLSVATGGPATPLVLPFAPGTGAAAFHRGATEIVVFDEPRPIDQAGLRQIPGYEQAVVQLLPAAVVLRLALPPGQTLAFAHDGTDWSLTLHPSTDPAPPGAIAVQADAGSLSLAAPGAARSITITDPQTGDTLLVGTQTRPGPHLEATRSYPDVVLLPTELGVALAPLADRVDLRAVPDGFIVAGDRPGTVLAISPIAPQTTMSLAAGRLTRQFALPDEPAPALLRRLHSQVADAASVPLQARLPYRRDVAQTMLALGMGAEAQAVLQVAATDDPRALADPATQDLAAAAAILAGRLAETAALASAAPGEPDERQMWRALRDAALLDDATAPDPATVQTLARTLPLLLSYPQGLRRTLLPLVADTLLRGHDLASADTLLATLPDAPGLVLARAVAAAAHGQDDAALAAYDLIASSQDRSARARAGVAALVLRLADHRITPAQAADAGDRLVYAWRGDARERDLRLQIADWRGAAGQYQAQLATLRDAAAAFPDPAEDMQGHLASALSALLSPAASAGMDRMPPLELVALMRDNADLLPGGPAGEDLAGRLADRLTALDLPRQSIDVLAHAMQSAPAGPARATLGARLAALDLTQGQAAAAQDALGQSALGQSGLGQSGLGQSGLSRSALGQSAADTASPALAEQRTLLAARASAALGDRPAALASLAPLADPPALLARAAVQEDAHDWQGVAATLGAYAAAALPATGALDSNQSSTVLRLASAAAQSGDEGTLARLRTEYAARLPDANDTALLALLTEAPVRNTTDLPRAARETDAARAVLAHEE